MTATDAALIALGERFEKLLLEHMDAWLEWAPRMRAAHAEVDDQLVDDACEPGQRKVERDGGVWADHALNGGM